MSSSTASPPRLLVIEDDQDLQHLLHDALEEMGYSCISATSRKQALYLIRQQPFDLIVTDTFSRTAQDALPSIRSLLDASHPTPVVVCTGWLMAASTVQQQGFAGLVQKPFSLCDLVTTVAECLNQPFNDIQLRQAEVVCRYFAAASQWEIDTLISLFAEEIKHYPWLVPADCSAYAWTGHAAARSYLQELADYFGPLRLDHVHISPCPDGLAARFVQRWRAPNGAIREQMVCLSFQITEDGKIYQVSMPLHDEYRQALLHAHA
jgi:CheY-like chemotaxis protein